MHRLGWIISASALIVTLGAPPVSAQPQPAPDNHRFKAIVSTLIFESCTPNGVGPWRVTWIMGGPDSPPQMFALVPDKKGHTASGNYSVGPLDLNGASYMASGRAMLSYTEAKDADGQTVRTYRLKGKFSVDLVKSSPNLMMLAKLMNAKPGGKGSFDEPVSVSKDACTSLDDATR